MTRTKSVQVSILGSAIFQPTADLIDKLTSIPMPVQQSVNSTSFEHGYSASIVLLLVAMFESYVVRVRYLHQQVIPQKRLTALDILNLCYPKLPRRKALTDVYVLRDVLIHNHLWETKYSFGNYSGIRSYKTNRAPGFGDKKYDERVSLRSNRTKALNLPVIPTRLNRKDVKRVFSTIWKTLIYLEQQDRNQCYVSHLPVRYRGKTVLFSELIHVL